MGDAKTIEGNMGAADDIFRSGEAEPAARPKLTLNWGGKCPAVPDVVFVDAVSPVTLAAAMEIADKQVLRVDPWTEPDAFDICLDCWRRWMGRNDTDLGAQTQKTLRGDGDGFGNADTSAARRDNEIAEATDAMINSMRMSLRWAIYKKCGISTAWRFPNLDFMAEAQEAVVELEKKLRTNIATRLLFG